MSESKAFEMSRRRRARKRIYDAAYKAGEFLFGLACALVAALIFLGYA